MHNRFLLGFFLLIFHVSLMSDLSAEMLTVRTSANASNRVQYAAGMLTKAFNDAGYKTAQTGLKGFFPKEKQLIVLEKNDPVLGKLLKKLKLEMPADLKKEGYFITTVNNITIILGNDGNGAIYGCRELIDRLQMNKKPDFPVNFTDAPEMVLRGTAIGMQKPVYLPGRYVYEYPYTPESFPWFYDKAHWIEYLDMLVANRMNSVYLWNGHPFASLVKLKDYPYAVEVDEATFKLNEETYNFITTEADKRGIFVIQMFYNIFLSKPFADFHGLKTQDRNRPITPLIADYTRKSIAAFIEKYPNVGLLVCLGEAMATYEDDVDLFVNTIIPGVKDGLKQLGRTDEPPVLLRAHDTDAKMVMEAALPLYKNLYTMHKYNGESLTTYEPRGPWTKIHTDLSALGSVHISNVHILANLEPWRYGSPEFIRKVAVAQHDIHGANALHLYPQASYWDWPFTADKLADGSRLKQIDRDWIWYKAWGRYAWNCRRQVNQEQVYWNRTLSNFYGVNETDAQRIKTAYDETGEIAPKLLRRFGITEGNRQTLLLGMFVAQLVNPYKYKIYPGFYESCGPEGEKLIEWSEKEWKKIPHVGELPLDIVNQCINHGDKAIQAIDKVRATMNTDEFRRLKNDVHCYREFAYFFENKVKAAKLVLDYQWGKDISKLDEAIPLLEKSLEHYAALVKLTKDTYLYANSMQTAQRRIPIGGDDGKNKTWEELYVHYQKELNNFKKNILMLKNKQNGVSHQFTAPKPLKNASVKMLSNADFKVLKTGEAVFADLDSTLMAVCPELSQMNIFALKTAELLQGSNTVAFETEEPVKLLVGYFRDDQSKYAKAPTLETDAAANEFGQADPVLVNALRIKGFPMINVHVYAFGKGKHQLSLPKGLKLIFGFTNDDVEVRDAGLAGLGNEEAMDWLFY